MSNLCGWKCKNVEASRPSQDENWGRVCGLSRIIPGEKLCSVSRKHRPPAAIATQVVETKQSNSGSYHTLYEQVGAGGLPHFPPLPLPNIALWVEVLVAQKFNAFWSISNCKTSSQNLSCNLLLWLVGIIGSNGNLGYFYYPCYRDWYHRIWSFTYG